MVLGIRRLGVLEDLERHRGERLVRVPLQAVADDRRREEERRRLTRHARHGERRPGEDAPDRLRQHDAEGRSPAADAEPERGLARRLRDEGEHLLGGARDQRDHQDREGEGAGERAQERDAGSRELVQVDRREDADRNRHGRREADDDECADERVGEPARLVREAERVRRLREQAPVDRRAAAPRDRDDHDREHADRGEGGQRRDRLHQTVDGAPPAQPVRVRGERAHRITGCRRATLRTIACAAMFATSEKTSRIVARYAIDPTWSFVVAPWYWLAIRLASVSPGWKSDQWIATAPPITCVTAIASPTARPSPRMSAAAIPEREYGRTTPRIISQRVVPSASAPSLSSRGTPRKSSRETLETIGVIMIVSTRIAGRRPKIDGSPRKSGRKPKVCFSHGSRWFATNGPMTRIPQRPTTTLGTAASISTSAPIGPRSQRGASSVRKSAIAIESGPAIRSAPSELTAVPKRNAAAPKTWRAPGSQSFETRKWRPKRWIAGRAWSTTFQAMRPRSATAAAAAVRVTPWRAVSPGLKRPRRRSSAARAAGVSATAVKR